MRKNQLLAIMLITLATSYGCKDVLKKTSGDPGLSTISSGRAEVVDLSSLKSDLAIISTRYVKLSLDCAYVTKAVKLKFLRKSEKKLLNGVTSWDILKEPALKRKLDIKHTNLNMELTAALQLDLSLNSSYEAVINVTPQVAIKTIKSNGKTSSSIVYNPNPADIYEQESQVIIDTTLEEKEMVNDSHAKLECTLNSVVKNAYKK